MYQAPWRHTKKNCVRFSLLETAWARDMTIFGFHVGPHICNIGYMEVYDGIWRSMDVYEGIWKYRKVYGGM